MRSQTLLIFLLSCLVIGCSEDESSGPIPIAVFDYKEFSNPENLTLTGNAKVNVTNGMDQDPVLRLTGADIDQLGSVYYDEPVDISEFSTSFSFRVTESGGGGDSSGERGGDGFALLIQTTRDASENGGAFIGYGGISPSVAVEFDTYKNTNDPDSNHVGVNIDGDANSLINTKLVDDPFDNEEQWFAWVDYKDQSLQVRVSTTPSLPGIATYSQQIDIPAILSQSRGFIGFTSATGAAYSNHDIIFWRFSGP